MIPQLVYRLFGLSVYMKLYARIQLRQYSRSSYKDIEQKALPMFVHRGDICIDIGANLGSYTYFLSKLIGENGAVYAFEPVAKTYVGLQALLRFARLNNVQAYNMGISDKSGINRIFVPRLNGLPSHGRASLSQQDDATGSECQEITLSTIDEFYRTTGLDRVDFIKIDIEGAELLALIGAEKVVSQHHPVLLLEVELQHTKRFGYTPRDLFQFLYLRTYAHVFYYNGETLVEIDHDRCVEDEDISGTLTREAGRTINNFFFLPINRDTAVIEQLRSAPNVQTNLSNEK